MRKEPVSLLMCQIHTALVVSMLSYRSYMYTCILHTEQTHNHGMCDMYSVNVYFVRSSVTSRAGTKRWCLLLVCTLLVLTIVVSVVAIVFTLKRK